MIDHNSHATACKTKKCDLGSESSLTKDLSADHCEQISLKSD